MILKKFFFTALTLLGFSTVSNAEAPQPVIYYILDASRSMWGRIDDKPKIDITKEVLQKFISAMPDDIQTGLTVYGHRSKSSCSDIEDVSQLGIMNKSKTIEKIKSLNPIGKSPIADAIQHAADAIKSAAGPKTIVLLSDGIEACGKDPCALVKSLKQGDSAVRIDVIGFNVDKYAIPQLHCIAKESGGRFFQASQSNELLDSLTQAQSQAVIEQEPLPTPIPTVKVRGNANVVIDHDQWLIKPFYWKLVDQSSGFTPGLFNEFHAENVPEGTYQLVWRQYASGGTDVILQDNITIPAGKVYQIAVDTAVELDLPTWAKNPFFWGLQDPATKDLIATYPTFDKFLSPSGEYNLVWRRYAEESDLVNLGKVKVIRGKLNTFSFNTGIYFKPAEWFKTEPYYWAFKLTGFDEAVAKYYGDFQPQLAAPGKYTLFYKILPQDSGELKLGEVELKKDSTAEFTINTGLQLKGEISQYDALDILELDQSDNIINQYHTRPSKNPIALQPGRYRVTLGSSNSSIPNSSDDIEVNINQLVQVDLSDDLHKTSIAPTELAPTAAPTAIATMTDDVAINQNVASPLPTLQASPNDATASKADDNIQVIEENLEIE